MTTALDIITSAFSRIGVYAPGETTGSADSATALALLNEMIDEWSNENLMCYANTETAIPLVVNQAAYSLTGAARPISINYAAGSAYVQDVNFNNWPITIRDQNTWNMNTNRSVTGNVPTDMFYDPQFPTGILNVYPVPNSGGYTLFFDATVQLAGFPDLSTAVSLPPGYLSALNNNMAVLLWADFLPGEPGQTLQARAAESKAWVKRRNYRPLEVKFDPELVSRGPGTYNIISNNYSR